MVTTELKDAYTLTITREQLPLLNDCIFQGVANAEQGEELMAMDGFRIAIHQQLHNQPVAAVPDAELIESVRRLHAFGAAMHAQRINRPDMQLDMGYPAEDVRDTEIQLECDIENAFIDLTDEDLARIDAWLAQQEGRDGNG